MKRTLRIILIGLILVLGYHRVVVPEELTLVAKEQQVTQALNFLELKRYDKELGLFIDKLGYDESRNNWQIINPIGAMGEWQFMEGTLKKLGYNITSRQFKSNPEVFPREVQERALMALIKSNEAVMQRYIDRYQDKLVNGIRVTKAGILAACHLAGPRNVQTFLLSDGRVNAADMYGTSVAKYMKNYQAYDLQLNLIT